jgi:hypothetical protein
MYIYMHVYVRKVDSNIPLSRKDSMASTVTKESNSQYDPDDDEDDGRLRVDRKPLNTQRDSNRGMEEGNEEEEEEQDGEEEVLYEGGEGEEGTVTGLKRRVPSILPIDKAFSPSMFLSIIHSDVSYEDLRGGLHIYINEHMS